MIRVIILLFFISVLNSCTKDDESEKIQTVTIGNQIWMAKNLDVETFQNGDPIPQVKDFSQWNSYTTGAWCYYNYNTNNGLVYGKLYNWYAVNDPRGIAPKGWRVATDNDWWSLITNLGGEPVAGGKLKAAGTQFWQSPNITSLSVSDFKALPAGGVINFLNAPFFGNINTYGYYWTNSPISTTTAYFRLLINREERIYRGVGGKEGFYSVRCVKN